MTQRLRDLAEAMKDAREDGDLALWSRLHKDYMHAFEAWWSEE